MKENVFRFYLVFVALRASLFLSRWSSFSIKVPFFFLFSIDKVTAVDSACLKGGEEVNSNKLSVSFIRRIHFDCLHRFVMIVAKKKKNAILFTAALVLIHFYSSDHHRAASAGLCCQSKHLKKGLKRGETTFSLLDLEYVI